MSIERPALPIGRGFGAARPPASKPFRQGDLDGLCGIYAIINALRRATRDESPEADAWPWLFGELLEQADKLIGATRAVVYGVDTKPLWKLAQHAVARLETEYDLPVTVTRPLKAKGKLTLPQVFDAIANALARDGTGVLAGLDGPLDHWTVVAAVTPLHLTLFDSSGYRRVRQDHCRLGQDKSPRGRHVLSPAAIFVFSLR